MNIVDETLSSQFDRLPPHSIESEMCALAAMVMDVEVRGEILGSLRRDDFYQADHQIIFDMMVNRHRAGLPVDWMLVREDLLSRHLLDEVGGVKYLGEIATSVPSAAHGMHYAKRVIQTARLRGLIGLANDAVRDGYGPGSWDNWEALCKKVGDAAYSLLNHGTTETIRILRDVLEEAIERKSDQKAKRIATGISELDKLIGGFPLARTTIIAGRPGSGKSLLEKQLALNITKRSNPVPVGIITIEEDRFKIADNVLSNESGVENRKIAYERCDAQDWHELYAAQSRLNDLPLFIDDQRFDLAGVEASVSRMATKYGCRVVFIDYLQLIDPGESVQARTRENEIAKMSRALKMTFKRLNIAGVVLAQLNRASGTDRPSLSNLRESGSIEQDGDLILLLHRPDYYNCNNPGFVPTHQIEVDAAKNKDGPTGVTPLLFDGGDQSVRDLPTIANPEIEF